MTILQDERRALAAAVLAFYGVLLFLVAAAVPPEWGRCFAALAGLYALGFFALVSGYFWARWFAMGLGLSGLVSAAISVFQVGAEPTLLIYGGTHAGLFALLLGRPMAERFDGRKEWRTRFHLDETATERLGKAVIRVGMSLPYLVMYALAPREESALAWIAVALVVAGTWGLLRLRTWGVFGLAGAIAALIGSGSLALSGSACGVPPLSMGAIATVLLATGIAPFVGPIIRFARRS